MIRQHRWQPGTTAGRGEDHDWLTPADKVWPPCTSTPFSVFRKRRDKDDRPRPVRIICTTTDRDTAATHDVSVTNELITIKEKQAD
jgi:hypothetical protein